jgi:hypothetical protein
VLPLVDLIMPDEEELTERIKDAMSRKHLTVATGGTETLAAFGLRAMSGALARNLKTLLQIDLSDIFVTAWNKSGTLRQHLEKSAHSPGKEIFLQLAEHKIASTHKPHVALMKDGAEIARVEFEAAVELVLQGAVLRLLDGAIQDVQTGRVKGKGSVKCFGATIVEKEIESTAIPGTLKIRGTRAASWMPDRSVRRAS